MANHQFCRKSFTFWLEDAALALLITVCTNVMRWFTALHFRLQRVGKRLMEAGNLLEFIPLLLSTPVFQASHFLFKLAYCFQQRKQLLLRRKCAAVGFQEFGLEFEELELDGLTVPQTYHRLREILSRIERRQETGDC